MPLPNNDLDSLRVDSRKLLDELVRDRWRITPERVAEYGKLQARLQDIRMRVNASALHIDLIEQAFLELQDGEDGT